MNPWISFEENPVFLLAGESHSLRCDTWSTPYAPAKWFKNGQELKDGDLNGKFGVTAIFDGVANFYLEFSKVELRHAGNYVCEVKNKYFARRKTLIVLVSCELVCLLILLLLLLLLFSYLV